MDRYVRLSGTWLNELLEPGSLKTSRSIRSGNDVVRFEDRDNGASRAVQMDSAVNDSLL